MSTHTRSPSHAGSWYTDHAPTLRTQLQTWLSAVPNPLPDLGTLPPSGARVIIAPHAGYSYSGPTAAWAYKCLDLRNCKRIFLLGPSHHLPIPNCALPHPSLTHYSTPLGSLALDLDTLSALRETREFGTLPVEADEDEHSLEMQLPYLRLLLNQIEEREGGEGGGGKEGEVRIVPILVGSTSPAQERHYGALLAPYLTDPHTAFIISSDFCHWGLRFSYTYYQPLNPEMGKEKGIRLSAKMHGKQILPINESIGRVDRECMDAVESGESGKFGDVLRRTANTVCGRHPIGVVMCAMEVSRKEGVESREKEGGEETNPRQHFKFIRYERSSEVKHVGDSSVSYASAFAVL